MLKVMAENLQTNRTKTENYKTQSSKVYQYKELKSEETS